MGIFTNFFNNNTNKTSSVVSLIDEEEETVVDYSTWEREAHNSIPDINLDNCSFGQYSQYQSSVRLANTFTNPGENSSFFEKGQSYSEHLEECYEKDVLKRGFLGLW